MKTIRTALFVLAVCVGICVMGCGKKETSTTPRSEQTEHKAREIVPAPVFEPGPAINNEKKTAFNASIEKAVAYLTAQFDPESGACLVEVQGHKGPSGAITSLAVMALLKSGSEDSQVKELIAKGADYLAGLSKEDGSIVLNLQEGPSTYTTAVALMVLNAVDKEKYKDRIKKAQDYLAGIQVKDEANPAQFGGIAYAPGENDKKTANLSTTGFAVEALVTSGGGDKEALDRAIKFLNRCQNNSETNDMEWAGNDGGAVYSPQESKAGEIKEGEEIRGYKSYGSMTYMEIKSFIYAGIAKNDPRIAKALAWIGANYTLEVNPGMKNGKEGLFYYYHTMAKSLSIAGVWEIEDSAGIKHNWREELGEKLISLQQADGTWINPEDRWFESIPVLVTSYAVIALDYCRK